MKSLDILEALADNNWISLSELSRKANLSTSTAYRVLDSLVKRQYVIKDEVTKHYRIGFKILKLSMRLMESFDIKYFAHPYLKQLSLESKETTQLVVLDGDEAVYLDKVDSPEPVKCISEIGARVPLYSTGSGKAILAFLEPAILNKVIKSKGFEQYIQNKFTTCEKLKFELEEIRRTGLIVNNKEAINGVISVSAPIFYADGKVYASICIVGPAYRFTVKKAEALGPIVKETALAISHKLGY